MLAQCGNGCGENATQISNYGQCKWDSDYGEEHAERSTARGDWNDISVT